MTTRRKKKSQDGFLKKVSSLFNLDTVSHSLLSRTFTSPDDGDFSRFRRNADRDLSWPKISPRPARERHIDGIVQEKMCILRQGIYLLVYN